MTDIYDHHGRRLDDPDDGYDTNEAQDDLLVAIHAYDSLRWDRCHDHRGADGFRLVQQAEYDRLTKIIGRLVDIAIADGVPERHWKPYVR